MAGGSYNLETPRFSVEVSALFFWGSTNLFIAEDYFALAHQLVIQP